MPNGLAGRLQWCDGLILFHGFWAALAMVKYAGLGQGIESGGIYMVEAVGAYLIGRCFIRNARHFKALAALMMVIVVVMTGFAAMESITGRHLIREVSRNVFGGPSLVPIEPRWGLHRAYGSFDHPILFGIFCASAFAFAFYALGGRRTEFQGYARAAATGLGTFLSLSAGAFSALGVQVALAIWDRVTRGVSGRWHILGGLLVAGWTLVSLLSNRSPIKVFLTYLTFSPGTAYNRIRVWEYGSAEAMRHPLLGIGLGDWERPVWMITIAGLSVAGCTVHYWNALFCLFCFLLGTGVWMTAATGTRRAGASLEAKSQIETTVAT